MSIDGQQNRSRKARRRKGDEPPSHISVRVTPEQYRQLEELTGGRMTISEYVISRTFAGGVRDTTLLQAIHALARAGAALQTLASNEERPRLAVTVLLIKVRSKIDKLARLLS